MVYDSFSKMDGLPEEIAYKILSYLPTEVLVTLELSNRQYWNIYRTRTTAPVSWDNKTIWLEKLALTNEMFLNDHIFVQSLFSLEVGYVPDTYTPKIPVKSGLVVFKQILDGYVWLPSDIPINFKDIKQILNEADTTTPPFAVDNSCGDITLEIFNKHLIKYVSSCIPSYDGYTSEEWTDEEDLKEARQAIKCNLGRKCKKINNLEKLETFPDDIRFEIPLILYIKEDKLDYADVDGNEKFVKYELDFVDKMRIDNFVIWKVLKDKQDIGRAVLSPRLHIMMENYLTGVAIFVNPQNVVYGFGNFNYKKLDKSLQQSAVFKKHNFPVVKENIHNRDPIEQWLIDARENGTL